MKTLDTYIAMIFARNLGVSTLGMTAIFLFQAIFGDLYDHRYTVEQVFIFHCLNLPRILTQMAPPSVLLATVLTLSGLARTQELVACYSIGFGLRRIMYVILLGVFLLSGVLLIAQDRILPSVFRVRTNYKWAVMDRRTDFFLDIHRDKIWYRSKNMIYNLKRFDTQAGTIHGISIYMFDESFNLLQVIGAEKAQYTSSGWKLLRGNVTVFPLDEPFPLAQTFEEKEGFIPETPQDFQEIDKEVEGLHLKELYSYIQRMKDAGADTKSYEVNFHSKISLSFIPVVMCFLAIPFSLAGRREGGVAKDLGLCLGVTFFYWLFYSVGLSLGTNGALPSWLAAWLPSLIFVALSGFLIARKQ